METHESYCVLTPDHYGPCAPTESEFYVADDEEKVLWRHALPPGVPYSDRPESEYQRTYKPLYGRARAACLEAAFKLGHLPSIRHHSRFTDAVEWPIEVTEETERGNLILKLPMGRFRLNARRARKGETTSEQVHAFGGQVIGWGGAAATDNESEPVKIFGRVIRWKYNESGYAFQPSSIEYADGTSSGFLGCDVRNLERIKEGPAPRPCSECGGELVFKGTTDDGDPNGTTVDVYECEGCGRTVVAD